MLDRLIDALLSAWRYCLPWVVLDEWERGVILRLGRFHRALEPGFHLRWPALEKCCFDTVVPDTQILASQPLTTRDQCPVTVQPMLMYQIRDLQKLLMVGDKERAMHDIAAGVVASLVAQHTWAELATPEFAATVYRAVRARGFRYGIEILEVQFPGLQKCRSYMLLQQHKYD